MSTNRITMPTNRRGLLLALGFSSGVLLAFGPALRGTFVWDDVIIYMLAKKSLWYFWSSRYQPDYWPVTYSALYLLWSAFHTASLGYHLVNVGLHLANVALWGLVLSQLAVKRGRLLALALFAVHPVQVESVAYIFQLKTLLGTTFFLCSLALYLRSRLRRDRASVAYLASSGCAFLALFAKTSTAMLPFTLVLAEVALAARSRDFTTHLNNPSIRSGRVLEMTPRRSMGALALRLLPFLAISIVGTAVTLQFNRVNTAKVPIWDAGPMERILTAAYNLWFYLAKLLVPWHYTVAYPRVALGPSEVTSYVPLVGLGLAALLVWRFRRALDGTLALGLAFFCLNLAPALGFTNVFFMKYSLVADHWAYLATMGVLLPLAVGIARLTERARAVQGALVAGLAAVSMYTSQAFADEETLWQRTLLMNPRADIAHSSLALLRYSKGDIRSAMSYYQSAIAARPSNDEAHFGLGRCYSELHDAANAELQYREALRINPFHAKSLNSLGLILRDRGRYEESRPLLERAVEIDPDYYEARNNLGLVYQSLGRDRDALRELRTAVQLQPNDDGAYVNLGGLYLRLKRATDAEVALRRALALNSRQAMAHFNLGVLYEELKGDRQAALAAYEEGLRLVPNNEMARRRLQALRTNELAR